MKVTNKEKALILEFLMWYSAHTGEQIDYVNLITEFSKHQDL